MQPFPLVNRNIAWRISAFIGFLAVALGAFGAHGLRTVLLRHDTSAIWETAAHYHLAHAVILLFIASREPWMRWTWVLFCLGVLIFSGSLYVLAVTNHRVLGAVTPVGGVLLLAGWISLAAARRPSH